MADIFISYSRNDQDIIEALRDLLEQEGFSVWWDANLYGGAKFEHDIEEQLLEAKAVIVVWSDSSLSSKFVQAEARIGFENDSLIPLTIEPIDIGRIAFTMRGIHAESIETWAQTRNPVDARGAIESVRKMVEANSMKEPENRSKATVELVYTQAIMLSDDPEDWKGYIEKFPHGDFVDVARKKIKELEGRSRRLPISGLALAAVIGTTAIGGGVAGAVSVGLLTENNPKTATVQRGDKEREQTVDEHARPNQQEFDPSTRGAGFSERRDALIEAATWFDGPSYSDFQANGAIRAANNLTDDEIASDEDLLKALERIVDSFFNAGRFDFAARVEAEHEALFKKHAEFYVSFCLYYGQKLMSSPAASIDNIWRLADADGFERDLAKYNEYAKLDVVEQRFPEYAILFEPGILKLQGAPDESIISRIELTAQLSDGDLHNFQRLLETSASALDDRSAAPRGTVLLTDRYRELIARYAGFDTSDNWTEIGKSEDIDMTVPETPT